MISKRLLVTAFAALAAFAVSLAARADDLSAAGILDRDEYFRLESAIVRYTTFDQSGHGYQSRAGPPSGPGDEALFVFEPELEVVIDQGEHIVHRVDVPVDIVTAASPDAIDLTSTASARNEAGAFDWTATYKRGADAFSIRTAFHGEENYRAWTEGAAYTRSLADDNAVFSASVNEGFDWFDKYTFAGAHDGHASRSSTNANVGLTQILSPTTVVDLNYGYTYQAGQLSNGWNIVPTQSFGAELERLPPARSRHAVVGRAAQYLPWRGALKLSYRFYDDDWSVVAHSVEAELDQRISPFAYLGVTYRLHHQTRPDFFFTNAPSSARYATADSDLDRFYAQTFGARAALDLPIDRSFARVMHLDLAVERYFRDNDLKVNVVSCSLGFFR